LRSKDRLDILGIGGSDKALASKIDLKSVSISGFNKIMPEFEIGPDSGSVTPSVTYLPFIGDSSGDSEETVDRDEDENDHLGGDVLEEIIKHQVSTLRTLMLE